MERYISNNSDKKIFFTETSNKDALIYSLTVIFSIVLVSSIYYIF